LNKAIRNEEFGIRNLKPKTDRQRPRTIIGALILYDGVCALCNGWVRFILPRDSRGLFRFAPLQGPTARKILKRHLRSQELGQTLFMVRGLGTRQEQLLDRSAAVFETLRLMGKPWSLLSVLRALPLLLTDGFYRLISRFRYRLAGRYDACPVPPPQYGSRFLD